MTDNDRIAILRAALEVARTKILRTTESLAEETARTQHMTPNETRLLVIRWIKDNETLQYIDRVMQETNGAPKIRNPF